ncbi:DUF401 family protein [candidate division WOR-3 bacterium]|nr:DUF401 family protein [candidate division WOR-3 bacterium]
MEILTWFGFFASIISLLLISRKSLPLALFSGGIILGLFTLPLREICLNILFTLTDPSIILLSVAMGVIPLIGGTMEESGQIDHLVNNLRIGKKALLALSPALMGMLPIPGGALLSAPIVEKGGTGVKGNMKTAINVWFRHLFVLIYPLSPALIASAKIAGLEVYTVILYVLPGFVFASILGYIFFLRGIKGKIDYPDKFAIKKLLLPLCIILLAPFLDFTLQKMFKFPIKEIATMIAVSSSLFLSWKLSNVKLNMKKIIVKMKPWNFVLIIIGMFVFLNIFEASNAAELIASLYLPEFVLCIIVGFILGLATGRVQLPASIVLPIYLVTYGSISLFTFSITYISIFFGYVLSPVHPCVSVSCEYFHIKIKDFLKITTPPVLIIIASAFIIFRFLS